MQFCAKGEIRNKITYKNMFTNTFQCFASQCESEEHLGQVISLSERIIKNKYDVLIPIKLMAQHTTCICSLQ